MMGHKMILKKRGTFGVKRIGLEGKIAKIEKSVSPVTPEKSGLNVFVKGLEGLGVVGFSPKQVEMIVTKATKKEVKKKKKAKKK